MVNHTKLIRALALSSLSYNTKRWLSACLKAWTASCRYNITLSPSFHARVGVPQDTYISPTLFNFFVFTFPQADNFLTSSYTDDFTVSAPFISALKSTVTLFIPQFVQSSTHHQVTRNNSILPLERTPCILGVTFYPHFKFNVHVRSSVTQALSHINNLKALTGTN